MPLNPSTIRTTQPGRLFTTKDDGWPHTTSRHKTYVSLTTAMPLAYIADQDMSTEEPTSTGGKAFWGLFGDDSGDMLSTKADAFWWGNKDESDEMISSTKNDAFWWGNKDDSDEMISSTNNEAFWWGNNDKDSSDDEIISSTKNDAFWWGNNNEDDDVMTTIGQAFIGNKYTTTKREFHPTQLIKDTSSTAGAAFVVGLSTSAANALRAGAKDDGSMDEGEMVGVVIVACLLAVALGLFFVVYCRRKSDYTKISSAGRGVEMTDERTYALLNDNQV